MSSRAESSSAGLGALTPSPPRDRFSQLLEGWRRRLDEELEEWLRRRHETTAREAGEATRELTDQLVEFVLRGGKRLRPALLYWAYRGCGGGVDGQVLPAAMAVELLHAYLLVHDDIMDRAETRRGGPAAHLAFQRHHRQSGWPGSSAEHGEAAAILLGDLAHSYAVELFLATDPVPPTWAEVAAAFNAMCREVVVGQYLEMTAPFRQVHDEEGLLEILRMKSGRYSVERPIELGALLAGAPSELRAGLAAYGLSVGEAFQLKDDLLGVFGEHEAVGKPVGGDLREGKQTLLIHYTLEAASEEQRTVVRSVLGNQEAADDEVMGARTVIEAVGARARIEEMVEVRMSDAAERLESLPLEGDSRQFFRGLLRFLKERRS